MQAVVIWLAEVRGRLTVAPMRLDFSRELLVLVRTARVSGAGSQAVIVLPQDGLPRKEG